MITTATAQGTREHQEDRIFYKKINPKTTVMAIMDGHNGHAVADTCVSVLTRECKDLHCERSGKSILETLTTSLNNATQQMQAGSTLALVLIHRNYIHIAILGDSPILLVHKDRTVWQSPEHNVRTNFKERTAAEQRGGVYSNGYICHPKTMNGLQLSRALGDAGMGAVVDRTFDVCMHPILDGDVVVLMTDGMIDPNHTSRTDRIIVHIASMVRSGRGAQALLNQVKRSGRLHDNASVLVWRADVQK